MAKITISALNQSETQVEEISTLKLGFIIGGGGKVSVKGGVSEDKGAYVEAEVTILF